MKLTLSAVLVLLFIGVVYSEALEAREPQPLVARTKGLPPPPLVARQDETTTTTTSPPATPSLPLPVPKVSDATFPSEPVDTGLPTPAAASGSVSGYAPSGTGSLIPAWSSLVAGAGGTLPSSQPTAPPKPSSTGYGTAPASTPNAAHKIENGLFGGAVIAGIVGLFL